MPISTEFLNSLGYKRKFERFKSISVLPLILLQNSLLIWF